MPDPTATPDGSPDSGPSAEQFAFAAALLAAVRASHDRLEALDARITGALTDLFDATAADIVRAVRRHADREGIVPAHELPRLQSDVAVILDGLRTYQEALINDALQQAAASGAQVADTARSTAERLKLPAEVVDAIPDAGTLAQQIVADVVTTPMADGLTLSDRIWAAYQDVRQQIDDVLRQAISTGQTARDAAREAVLRGGAATPEQIRQIELARAGALGEQVDGILRSDAGKAYSAAERVFRTELNRANLDATRESFYAASDVVAEKAVLSPLHPRFDICDIYCKGNFHGLGAGIYPRGQSPIPAHPNTLTKVEPVFRWEIAADAVAGQQSMLDYLAGLNEEEQYAVVQSQDKLKLLRSGQLKPEDITRPWNKIAPRYT